MVEKQWYWCHAAKGHHKLGCKLQSDSGVIPLWTVNYGLFSLNALLPLLTFRKIAWRILIVMGRSVTELNDLDFGSDRCDTKHNARTNAWTINTTTNRPSEEHRNHGISVPPETAFQPQCNKSGDPCTIARTHASSTVSKNKVRGWLLRYSWCFPLPLSREILLIQPAHCAIAADGSNTSPPPPKTAASSLPSMRLAKDAIWR
jgi:hypothetical protein